METILQKDHCFLFNTKKDIKKQEEWHNTLSILYEKLKEIEPQLKLDIASKNSVLNKLYLDDVDSEQIWQQLELQNNVIHSNLNVFIGQAAQIKHTGHFNSEDESGEEQSSKGNSEDDEDLDIEEKSENEVDEEDASGDEVENASGDEVEAASGDEVEDASGDEVEDASGDEADEESIDDSDDASIDDSDDDSIDDSDEEEKAESDENHPFGKDIDFDADTFGDLVVDSDEGSEDEEGNIQKAKPNINAKIYRKDFRPSNLDSPFFNLRHCEWIADNDLLGGELGDNIDLMAAVPSDDEDDITYDTFFDPPNDNYKNEFVIDDTNLETEQKEGGTNLETEKMKGGTNLETEKKKGGTKLETEKKKVQFNLPKDNKYNHTVEDFPEKRNSEDEENNLEFETEENQEQMGFNNEEETGEEQMEFNEGEEEKEEGEPLSRFARERLEEEEQKREVEEENYILEKPWALKGEATKEQRPVDSTLTEDLDYTVAAREKPLITEELTAKIEKLILSRIKRQAFDDVEKKIKPGITAHEYKEKMVLDSEKSKKSLAELFAEDYNKASDVTSTQKSTEEESKNNQIYEEIQKKLDVIWEMLDPLTNYHYTPKLRDAKVRVTSNLSAITLEETTPMITSDATMLAPQEIVAPRKGELKSDREKTSTDRKRERRAKKLLQKKKAHHKEQVQKVKELKKGKDGLMTKEASHHIVEKALRTGQIKKLQPQTEKVKYGEVQHKTNKRKAEDVSIDNNSKKKSNKKQ